MPKLKHADCEPDCCPPDEGDQCGGFCETGTNVPEAYNLNVPAATFDEGGATDEGWCTESRCDERTGLIPLTKIPNDSQYEDSPGVFFDIWINGPPEDGCLYISDPIETCSMWVDNGILEPDWVEVVGTYWWQAQIVGGVAEVWITDRAFVRKAWRVEFIDPEDFSTIPQDCTMDITGLVYQPFSGEDPPPGCLIDDTQELALEIPV